MRSLESRAQALSVGHALDVDSARSGVVHSVFSRAVNLTIGGDMWTLLAEEKSDLPFGIRVTLPSFDAHGLRRGDPVNIRAGYVGVGSRIVIDCRASARWVPDRPDRLEQGLQERLAVVATAARNRPWCKSAQMARGVRTALDEPATLDAVVAQIVGRGPGATPSGDDVLVGILAVLTSPHSGAAGAEVADWLSRSILPLLPTTTDVSRQLLRQATYGLFGRDVHELVSALIGDTTPDQLRENVRQLVDAGATSGADMCEGLLAFAPLFFTYPIVRAAA